LIVLPALEDETNATELRQLLRSGAGGVEALLPASVLDYIRDHRLYK